MPLKNGYLIGPGFFIVLVLSCAACGCGREGKSGLSEVQAVRARLLGACIAQGDCGPRLTESEFNDLAKESGVAEWKLGSGEAYRHDAARFRDDLEQLKEVVGDGASLREAPGTRVKVVPFSNQRRIVVTEFRLPGHVASIRSLHHGETLSILRITIEAR